MKNLVSLVLTAQKPVITFSTPLWSYMLMLCTIVLTLCIWWQPKQTILCLEFAFLSENNVSQSFLFNVQMQTTSNQFDLWVRQVNERRIQFTLFSFTSNELDFLTLWSPCFVVTETHPWKRKADSKSLRFAQHWRSVESTVSNLNSQITTWWVRIFCTLVRFGVSGDQLNRWAAMKCILCIQMSTKRITVEQSPLNCRCAVCVAMGVECSLHKSGLLKWVHLRQKILQDPLGPHWGATSSVGFSPIQLHQLPPCWSLQ